MYDIIRDFIDTVSENDELQSKYLENWQATEFEKNELRSMIKFFVEECSYNVEYVAEAYLFINHMVREETYYFIRNGKYRFSTFSEVDQLVYNNHEYMEKYMIGLTISDYIWINHIKMLRYFEDNYDIFYGKRYLEIGPGYGQYLIKALISCRFNEYCACDISKTSVDGCNKYLKYRGLSDKCNVIQKDFFEYDVHDKFDCIVMGEVLEHVEQPFLMLKKIYELLTKDGKAFISTVINAPTLDHIWLFSSIEEVLILIKKAGFKILDYMCATEGDISLEKARKRKQAINIAVIVKK